MLLSLLILLWLLLTLKLLLLQLDRGQWMGRICLVWAFSWNRREKCIWRAALGTGRPRPPAWLHGWILGGFRCSHREGGTVM